MKKNDAEAVAGFGITRRTETFFNSFKSSRTSSKYQCLNCEAWKQGRKLIAIAQYDHAVARLAVFRFCRPCWRSYERSTGDLKQAFISRIREKIRKASEVIIDESS